ncbi:hypothetical protein JAAARDRAFT_197006 [Jaapia argillacea MUCL 33604]|uniref:Uncharacterized protein n=1 Tax=Jaapia argillacea MUCL 33604 TaxID=933084 RepID=A0A067PRG2_9AGAM|nr:hypothetical protein JAAARDRAFT_197006 [Jaapia argillacea MUCL 33604]
MWRCGFPFLEPVQGHWIVQSHLLLRSRRRYELEASEGTFTEVSDTTSVDVRFSAPRSLSPEPRRRQPRKSFTFGLPSDDEDYDSSDESQASGSSSSSSSASAEYETDSEVAGISRRPARGRSAAEQRYIEDTIASIRLRTRHKDPYEEWQKQLKHDSLLSLARRLHVENKLPSEPSATPSKPKPRKSAKNDWQPSTGNKWKRSNLGYHPLSSSGKRKRTNYVKVGSYEINDYGNE